MSNFAAPGVRCARVRVSGDREYLQVALVPTVESEWRRWYLPSRVAATWYSDGKFESNWCASQNTSYHFRFGTIRGRPKLQTWCPITILSAILTTVYIFILCVFFLSVVVWVCVCVFSRPIALLCLDFYLAMPCIRGTSHGPVSVRLSVTSRCSTKTAKRRIAQTTPHDSPGTLVFWRQRSLRNSIGVTPFGGAKCRWGGSKSATFDK